MTGMNWRTLTFKNRVKLNCTISISLLNLMHKIVHGRGRGLSVQKKC